MKKLIFIFSFIILLITTGCGPTVTAISLDDPASLIDDDPMEGDPNAPVTIVEFSDYKCPYCQKYSLGTYPQIKESYIDTGKVRYVFRDLALSIHYPVGMQAAIAAECIRDQKGNEGYFEYHDYLFQNQSTLDKDQLYKLADLVGVDAKQFGQCLESEKYLEEVAKDISDAGKLGITSTPTFIINDQKISGAYPFVTFSEIIEKELKKKEN